jgi:N-acetylneuraminic acid mutarotase
MRTCTSIFSLSENRTYNKAIVLLFGFLFSFAAAMAQPGYWTWTNGDNTTNRAGVYGTKGTPANANKPGSRHSHTVCRDGAGNCWLFGGVDVSFSTGTNDLWRYNPGTNQWTWMSGDNYMNAAPVYGTKGVEAANNKPGARYGHASWVDAAGNIYIYGGLGYDRTGNAGYLNDLWRYRPATNRWTWIAGDNTRDNRGTYGTRGTAAANNDPGGRYYHTGWIDAAGTFWIFGGLGYDNSNNTGGLNDLWSYNPANGRWTWESGANTRNQAGTYGAKGTPAAANRPGNRSNVSSWVDGAGNFWIYGGRNDNSSALYNDLWRYNPGTDRWTWISGDNTANNPGAYGTKGIPAANNRPGARLGQNGTIDAAGDFWIFGQSLDMDVGR